MDAFPSAREQIGQENQQTRATTEQERMREFLQENSASILGVLRVYVQRMGLAHGSQVPEMALEIFQETASEVLAHAERFAGDAQPMPLLLGIAANMIRRRKVEQAKRFQREQLLSDVARRYPGIVDEDTLLDTLVPPAAPEPAQVIESNEEAAALLALVSPEDQRVLRLAILDGHQHTSLARELGTTPGTARMRLHRALSRLRAAWQTQQEKLQKETRHA